MTARVELTGAGLVQRDAAGRTLLTVTMAEGPGIGEATLLILVAGARSIELALDLDALQHLREVAHATHANVAFAAALEGESPCVPRRDPLPSFAREGC
ncbi:hypothetical protein QO001_002226 [Methylobacterium brachiatum]|uniref:Uncharacterized protein n=1 Tax=Methylobacterium brachiatum TaxID=269660 RepID=A0AAJ1WWJ8_9HYPH|nr:hypothetical protein [Methylobacterium brachiatum]MCB4802673.1 hypothetical protein [Methylobacterium brachiatum]MDQ0543300.1 hypothetical protein [Methylobacterium brachiatum]